MGLEVNITRSGLISYTLYILCYLLCCFYYNVKYCMLLYVFVSLAQVTLLDICCYVGKRKINKNFNYKVNQTCTNVM